MSRRPRWPRPFAIWSWAGRPPPDTTPPTASFVISAAYGIVLGARARLAQGGDWRAALEEDFRLLADSRPTAVNLFWALNRMRDRLERMKEGDQPLAVLEAEAISIH